MYVFQYGYMFPISKHKNNYKLFKLSINKFYWFLSEIR